jgi:hypothetical protein
MESMAKRSVRLLVAGGAVLTLIAGGVAYSAGLISCSSGDSSAGDAGSSGSKATQTPESRSPFVGSWNITGTTYSSCGGQAETSQSIQRTWVISAGASSSTLSLKMDDACIFVLKVEGNTANMEPGPICQGGDAGEGSTTTLSSLSMTIGASGAAIQTRGNVRLTISGNSFDCAMRGEYTGQRAP